MKFECGDLDRALANPDWMPEARENMQTCAACREEYRLWTEMSVAARQLHHEWPSADLWPAIRQQIESEQRQHHRRPQFDWKFWSVTAAAAAFVLFLLVRWRVPAVAPATQITQAIVSGRDFLTDKALSEAEKNEQAYRRSIEQLSTLAQPRLAAAPATSPLITGYREKLLLLDAAIDETRSQLAANRLNAQLQMELAGLYRDKRQTLQDILTEQDTHAGHAHD